MSLLSLLWAVLALLAVEAFRPPVTRIRVPPNQQCRHVVMMAGGSLADRVKDAVMLRFSGQDISRVLQCWTDFAAGKKLERYLDEGKEVFQTADCFVEGLRAIPFHDPADFAWIPGLEANYQQVLEELTAYEYRRRGQEADAAGEVGLQLPPSGTGKEGDGDWLGPRDTSGTHYGPEWKTLGIQDRSVWDSELIHEFPRTIKLMTDNKVPSCEVFFAKQGARSGLKPHSDKNNFIMTCHLALDVPEGQCWIRVGNQEHHWLNGKTCVFDTSIFHSTENTSDRVRYVLLIRFWHPDLLPVEVDAFKFIFAYLDHAGMGEEALERFEMQQLLMGKDQHKGLQKSLGKAPASAGLFSDIRPGGMGVEKGRAGKRDKAAGGGGGGSKGSLMREASGAQAAPRARGFGGK